MKTRTMPVGGPKPGRLVLVAVVTSLVLGAWGCDKPIPVKSAWSAAGPKVDGLGEDWADVPLQSFGPAEVSLGVRNDADNLYLLIATWDVDLIRVLGTSGLTLWLDPTGKKQKTLGLHLAGGLAPAAVPEAPEDGEAGASPPPRPALWAPALSVAVIDHDRKSTAVAPDGRGLKVAAHCEGQVCAYELRIPLVRGQGDPIAAGALPGGSLGLGAELQVRAKRSATRPLIRGFGGQRSANMDATTGMDGMGEPEEDQATDGRGQPGGAGSPKLEQKQIWFRLTLATAQAG